MNPREVWLDPASARLSLATAREFAWLTGCTRSQSTLRPRFSQPGQKKLQHTASHKRTRLPSTQIQHRCKDRLGLAV